MTSYGVGMAVPDWPTTFGINMFLYNFWNAPFGVRLEHTHRLYGAAVGLATVVLAGWLLAFDRRRFMKVLGVVALAAVIAQGVMGGLRVARISTDAGGRPRRASGRRSSRLMVALCVLTGPRSGTTPGRAGPTRRGSGRSAAVMLAPGLRPGRRRRLVPALPDDPGALDATSCSPLAVWGHAAGLFARVARPEGRGPRALALGPGPGARA